MYLVCVYISFMFSQSILEVPFGFTNILYKNTPPKATFGGTVISEKQTDTDTDTDRPPVRKVA